MGGWSYAKVDPNEMTEEERAKMEVSSCVAAVLSDDYWLNVKQCAGEPECACVSTVFSGQKHTLNASNFVTLVCYVGYTVTFQLSRKHYSCVKGMNSEAL